MAAPLFPTGRDVEYAAALARHLQGRSDSEALAGDLDKRFPEDYVCQIYLCPVLRALSDYHQGRTAKV